MEQCVCRLSVWKVSSGNTLRRHVGFKAVLFINSLSDITLIYYKSLILSPGDNIFTKRGTFMVLLAERITALIVFL